MAFDRAPKVQPWPQALSSLYSQIIPGLITMAADTLEEAQHFIYVTQVYFCSMYAVVLWDWVISLPREWRFIWKTHWTPVKMAYLFCRYWVIAVVPYLLFAFVVNHSLAECEKMYRIPVALAMWNQVGSSAILLIRTYAFFNRNVFVLIFLGSSIAGVGAYQLYVATSQMQLLPFVTPPFTSGPCFPSSKPHSAHLLGFFIAPLLFDTVVTFMTVWKAITIRRRNGGPNSRLIQTFLREGVFYYLLISIANLINGVFYLQPRQVISAINIPLSVMLGPVLACRLILDLRERGSETVSHSEGTGIAAFTTKSNTQNSPFSAAEMAGRSPRNKYTRPNRTTTNISSAVILSTIGTIVHPEDLDLEAERDAVELNDLRMQGLGRSTTRTTEGGSPAPAYHSLEMGFAPRPSHSLEGGVSGIRVDVEKTTASM